MYSVVLATMLAAGTTTPSWHHYGCHGCWGGSFGCQGCHSSYGCGGCSGYSTYGCGGCSGCWGGYYTYGCHGCSGCSGWYGCSGCHGSYYGCWGCSGCSGVVYSYPVAGTPVYQSVAPSFAQPQIQLQLRTSGPQTAGMKDMQDGMKEAMSMMRMMNQRLDAMEKRFQKLEKEESNNGGNDKTLVRQSQTAQAAEVIVRLPADARLFVDNVPCPLTSGTRAFKTPRLEPGKNYFYHLRAEVVRDGQTRSENLRVILASGQQVRVEFTNLTPPAQTVRR